MSWFSSVEACGGPGLAWPHVHSRMDRHTPAPTCLGVLTPSARQTVGLGFQTRHPCFLPSLAKGLASAQVSQLSNPANYRTSLQRGGESD